MNREQAKQLINNILAMWQHGTVEQLSELYAKDVEAHCFGHDNLSFSDIENRVAYIGEKHQNRAFELHEVLLDGNKVTIRMSYKAEDEQGQFAGNDAIAIYQFNDEHKVSKMWVYGNIALDYLAKHGE